MDDGQKLNVTAIVMIVLATVGACAGLFAHINNQTNEIRNAMSELSAEVARISVTVGYLEQGLVGQAQRLPDPQEKLESEPEPREGHALSPSDQTPGDRARAQAASLAEEGRIGDAIDVWREALKGDEEGTISFDAYVAIADLESDRGRYRDAIHMYDEAIKLDPDSPGVYFNRGTAKNAIGSFEAAIEDFDQAIRFAPFLAAAYSNRGFSKASLDDVEGAIDDYSKAIDMAPNFSISDLSVPYKNRALARARLGLVEEANADFEKAMELDPSMRSQ